MTARLPCRPCMLGGYIVVSSASIEEAEGWAVPYLYAVEADEVDVRELEP